MAPWSAMKSSKVLSPGALAVVRIGNLVCTPKCATTWTGFNRPLMPTEPPTHTQLHFPSVPGMGVEIKTLYSAIHFSTYCLCLVMMNFLFRLAERRVQFSDAAVEKLLRLQ